MATGLLRRARELRLPRGHALEHHGGEGAARVEGAHQVADGRRLEAGFGGYRRGLRRVAALQRRACMPSDF